MVNQVLGCGRIGVDADPDAGDGAGGEGRGRDTRHEQRVLTILRLWVGDGERLVVAPTADSPERLRLAVQEYRRPWTETLPGRR